MMDDSSMFPSMTSSVKRLNPSVNSAFISKTTTDDVRVSDDESDDESNDESDDESDDELDELDVANERNNPGTNNPQILHPVLPVTQLNLVLVELFPVTWHPMEFLLLEVLRLQLKTLMPKAEFSVKKLNCW
jgi:hypothetical protein